MNLRDDQHLDVQWLRNICNGDVENIPRSPVLISFGAMLYEVDAVESNGYEGPDSAMVIVAKSAPLRLDPWHHERLERAKKLASSSSASGTSDKTPEEGEALP